MNKIYRLRPKNIGLKKFVSLIQMKAQELKIPYKLFWFYLTSVLPFLNL